MLEYKHSYGDPIALKDVIQKTSQPRETKIAKPGEGPTEFLLTCKHKCILFLILSWAIAKQKQFFHMLQTLKLIIK